MSIRVSQRQIYSSLVTNMNSTLAEYMKLQEQSSSQLRINRPSDDPIGAAKVLQGRASLARLDQYSDSINAAKGWLSAMDSALTGEGSITTVLTRIKTLAQQVSSGTYTADNREEVSFEIREALKQLITLANTSFEGRSVFGGHKTDTAAFVEALGVTCLDANGSDLNACTMTATGGASGTVLIQFTDGAGTTAGTAAFRYSKDGGATWTDGTATIAANGLDAVLDAGGVAVTIHNGANEAVSFVDPDKVNQTDNGTWLYVRPTAVYQGDDHDTQVVIKYGGSGLTPTADGNFTQNVAVKIDKVENGVISYYYSTDDGSNWVMATAPDEGANTRLPVSGGFLNLGGVPAAGDQFIVEPRRADVNFTISSSDYITVNMVGKDVFGGLYQEPFADPAVPTVVGDPSANMFEVVGRLIAYTETNSQQGVQECLADLEKVMAVITTKAAVVGGRKNRLEVTEAALSMRKLDENEHLSAIEDVDVTELMTKISQQQIAYNSVLKTSSMIMQMSLLNFL